MPWHPLQQSFKPLAPAWFLPSGMSRCFASPQSTDVGFGKFLLSACSGSVERGVQWCQNGAPITTGRKHLWSEGLHPSRPLLRGVRSDSELRAVAVVIAEVGDPTCK